MSSATAGARAGDVDRQERYEMDIVEAGRSYAVGWGTLALINAGLAQSKGRSRMAWFLASLLFGPLATFIIVVTDEPAPK
jgi:hypothetical protein